MAGVSEPPETEYTVTEVSVTVLRRKQIEEYEPFEASETITAEVTEGADIDAVTSELHDAAKEHVQRDIVKRVEEKRMKDELEG